MENIIESFEDINSVYSFSDCSESIVIADGDYEGSCKDETSLCQANYQTDVSELLGVSPKSSPHSFNDGLHDPPIPPYFTDSLTYAPEENIRALEKVDLSVEDEEPAAKLNQKFYHSFALQILVLFLLLTITLLQAIIMVQRGMGPGLSDVIQTPTVPDPTPTPERQDVVKIRPKIFENQCYPLSSVIKCNYEVMKDRYSDLVSTAYEWLGLQVQKLKSLDLVKGK